MVPYTMQVSAAVSEPDTTVTLWHTCRLWLLSLSMPARLTRTAQHCGDSVTVPAVLVFQTTLALVSLLLLVDTWAEPGCGTRNRGCHQLLCVSWCTVLTGLIFPPL